MSKNEEKDKKIEIQKGDKKEKVKKAKKEEQKSRELSIRRENPFSLFQKMDKLFDDLRRSFFDDFYWPFSWRRTRPLSLEVMEDEPIFRTPLANITEDEKFFTIAAELPGIDKGDLEITIHDGTLEIKGEHKEERKEKEGELVRREYHSSSYYRAFTLPEHIDEDKIESNLDKGILNIKIPKVEPPEPKKKKIEVK
ncbi:MAG: Hsp20/alpha crystallin family protein [Promethearchaeota archaeon]